MIRVWQQRVLHIERTLLNKYICNPYKPYKLQSKLLKGGYIGSYIGTTIRVIKRDTRSLDYSSYNNPNFPHYLAVSGPYGSAGFLAHADGPFGLSSHSAPWLSVDSTPVARSRRSAKGSGALLLPVILTMTIIHVIFNNNTHINTRNK